MTEKKPAKGEIAVTFAREWTIGDKSYKPDESAVLPLADLDEALRFGYARPDDSAVAQAYGFPVPSEKKGA